MPKQYGSPGFQPPGQTSAKRPQAKQASPEEIHRQLDAYEKHIRDEHARIQYVRKVVPRGSSTTATPKASRPGMPLLDARIDKMSK